MLTSLDLFLISLALVVLAFGLSRRFRILRAGRPEECSGNWTYLLKYLFGHKKSVISQREVLTDTKSFQAALKYILREDPDVIMVGANGNLES